MPEDVDKPMGSSEKLTMAVHLQPLDTLVSVVDIIELVIVEGLI